MNGKIVILLCALVPLGCMSVTPESHHTPPSSLEQFIGFWQNLDEPGIVIEIDQHRRVDFAEGQIRRTGRLLGVNGDRFTFCVYGENVTERIHLTEETLRIEGTQGRHSFRRLSAPPPDLQDRPTPIPPPMPLPPPLIENIQREIRQRFRDEMRAQMEVHGTELGTATPPPVDPIARIRLLDISSQNRAYLSRLVQQVGWIDATRFGYATSNSAALMVQHSGDRLLMEAALSFIEKDVTAGLMTGDAYALIYDRLHLMLGEKQRFGSQINREREDAPVLYPIEDPESVDTRRGELGLLPLSEYVRLFGGTEIRISEACSSEALASYRGRG